MCVYVCIYIYIYLFICLCVPGFQPYMMLNLKACFNGVLCYSIS